MAEGETAAPAVSSAPDAAAEATSEADATTAAAEAAARNPVLYGAPEDAAEKEAAEAAKPDAEKEREEARRLLREKREALSGVVRERKRLQAERQKMAEKESAIAAREAAFQRELAEAKALRESGEKRAKLRAEDPLAFIREEGVDFVELTRRAMEEGTPDALARVALQRAEAAERKLEEQAKALAEWRESQEKAKQEAEQRAAEEAQASIRRQAETRLLSEISSQADTYKEVALWRETMSEVANPAEADRMIIAMAWHFDQKFAAEVKAGRRDRYTPADILAALDQEARVDNTKWRSKFGIAPSGDVAPQGAPGKPAKPGGGKTAPPKTISPSVAAGDRSGSRPMTPAEREAARRAVLYGAQRLSA